MQDRERFTPVPEVHTVNAVRALYRRWPSPNSFANEIASEPTKRLVMDQMSPGLTIKQY